MLLEHGADPNVQSDNFGSTPLMLTVKDGYTEIARALLEKGANTGLKNHRGQTALFSAAREGRVEIVQLILATGADANTKTEAGFSAIYVASMNGHDDIVKLLLEAGADPNATADVGGEKLAPTPLKAAQQGGHVAIVERLKAAGARE